MRYDTCACGREKDKRASQCRTCWAGAVPDRKRCTSCAEEKPVSAFRIRTRAVPRPRSICRECEAEQRRVRDSKKSPEERKRPTREWERCNPKKFALQRLRRRCRTIGIPEEQIAEVVERYQATEACDICGAADSGNGRGFHLDHCHETGKFRGVLCHHCNLALGHFQDDVARVLKAVDYLSHPTSPGK